MGSMIFIAVLTACFILVSSYLIVSAQQRKNGRKRLLQSFAELSAQYDFTFDTKQVFKNRIIAIDRFNLHLLFLDRNSGHDCIHVIDLREIAFCHVVKRKDPIDKHISKIFIECIAKNQETVHLTFYDERFDKMDAQLALAKNAERWRKKIRMYQHYSDVYNENGFVFT